MADLGGLARPGDPGGCALDAPLAIVGYSIGCTVAHEVACRLVGTGREVPLLALLDFAPPPDGALARDRRRRFDRAVGAVRAGDLRSAAGQAELLVTDPLAPFLLALVDRVPAVADRRTRLTMANGRRAAALHRSAPWAGRTLLGWSAPDPTGVPGGATGCVAPWRRSPSAAITSRCSTDRRSTTSARRSPPRSERSAERGISPIRATVEPPYDRRVRCIQSATTTT